MDVRLRQLRLGERLELEPAHDALQLILGGGRAAYAAVRGGFSLWVPLRGELHLETGEGVCLLKPGRMLVWAEGPLRVGARSYGLWLGLVGTVPVWSRLIADALPMPEAHDPLLYPRVGGCPYELRRLLLRIAGSLRRADPAAGTALLVEAAMAALWDLQRPIEALVERCTGRSYTRRRQNLLRLLRVRNRIGLSPTSRPELPALAELANYSPWHFIRAFREVFGEAPCEYANRLRLEYARRLIESDRLTISEVAGMAGYDSRSAFCRSFRHAFGMTATQARRRSQENRCARPYAAIAPPARLVFG